jgi:hypothetical protein
LHLLIYMFVHSPNYTFYSRVCVCVL